MLEIRRVSKRLGPNTQVLSEFSWSVPARSQAALTGPVGTGKTTLLRLIAGLDRLDEGEIHWNGIPWSAQQHHVVPWKRSIAMVFQHATLWPHLSVQGQLEFVASTLPTGAVERNRRVAEIIERLSLETFVDRHPAELSGGQQQCVAVARSLVRQPQLMIMDEPFSQMDEGTRMGVWSTARELLRAWNSTLILVTHDMDWARDHFHPVRHILDAEPVPGETS